MTPPKTLNLKSGPAGTVNLVVDNVQTIDESDLDAQGWLPVADVPSGWTPPNEAAFAYNIDQDPALKALWPPVTPFEGHNLHRDGTLLQYGVAYVFTADTIWWLTYNPALTVIDNQQDAHPGYGNAPWSLDYVDIDNPGTPMQLRLALYQDRA